MPDVEKISRLKKIGWHKVKSCATCRWSSSGSRNKVTFGYCQHPDALYKHKKQGERKLPSHAGAVCERWEEIIEEMYKTHGLDKLNELVNG
jgi:hypothetical protein